MKTKIWLWLATCLMTVAVSCSEKTETTEEKCGSEVSLYSYRTSHGTGFFTPVDLPFKLDVNYMGGSTTSKSAVYFYKWQDEVCPQEHIKATFSISADIDGDFTVKATADYFLLFQHPFALSVSNDGVSRHWEAKGDFGIKNAYGDDPKGEFQLTVYIEFPYQGSYEADTTYLFNKLQNVTVEATFKRPK